jgi:hypothetical protein
MRGFLVVYPVVGVLVLFAHKRWMWFSPLAQSALDVVFLFLCLQRNGSGSPPPAQSALDLVFPRAYGAWIWFPRAYGAWIWFPDSGPAGDGQDDQPSRDPPPIRAVERGRYREDEAQVVGVTTWASVPPPER